VIRAYLRNPGETALVSGLAIGGLFSPYALAAAAILFCVAEIVAGVRKLDGPRWWPAAWPATELRLTILYDGTCGLCVRSKATLERWPTARVMTFLPLQAPEARSRIPGMSDQEFLGAIHVLDGDRVHSGVDGWFRIVRIGPIWLAAIAGLTPRWLARPVYDWIARNRYRWFGRVCEKGSCAVHAGRKP
jgi:predicted DCC family thiol-disulfide oxidoreductase YuxK